MDLYTQFDGEEIGGKRYELGEAISRDTDTATVHHLLQIGRLSDQKPTVEGAPLIPTVPETPLSEMSREELETTARNSIDLSELSNDELIAGIERHRDAARGEPVEDKGDAFEEQGTGTPTPTPPEPPKAPEPRTDEQLAEVLKVPVQSVAIAVNGMDDVAEIERLRALEVKGEDRQTALAAIDKRLAALKSTD